MKRIFIFLLVVAFFFNTQAQFKSPYKLNLATDITLPIVSVGMIGAAFMAKKKKFTKFGMFDEDFFFYWEDIDFSSRIKNKGYKIYINLDSIAFHKSGTSSKNDFQTLLIRNINFKFGEYLFSFKNKKLRLIKIIRQLLQNIIFIMLNLIIFRLKNSLINACYLFGILKFLLFWMGINYKNKIQ